MDVFWRYSASNNFLGCELTDVPTKELLCSLLCVDVRKYLVSSICRQ